MTVHTDIDIDLVDRDAALGTIRHIPAIQADHTRHNTGVYFQNIPVDPRDGLATIDTKTAADFGYFKIDLLNNTLYEGVRDEAHLVDLAMREPPWELFDDELVVEQLHHIHSHFRIVQSIQPRSVEDVAVVIALIRPGKKHLVGQPRDIIDAEIWKQTDEYAFKKSHAISYALSIVVQLNLLLDSM